SDGSILFASNIDILAQILSRKLDYNWNYLYSYLIYGNSSSVETPFQNVYEIPPACYLDVSKSKQIVKPLWDPLRPSQQKIHTSKNAVDVIKSTLKPWVAPYDTVCVSL